MSKINAVRIINLNYNNNSIRISDETFQLGGQSTLMSLRNGGGKSVLVQMMTAPFVHKQYRKTKDRPFESYFTSSKPTFIMVEWALDHGAGYCLVGMMVRRSQVSEEQSSEPLEIINFISEYPSRCNHDIYNIPVVEKGRGEIILKNFGACRQLFEDYKKDRNTKFFYYDMNNFAQSRQYFDKLTEYQIYYKEWETIIRKVNIEESGLSKLFSDCRNEKELIEKWFLDAIESKLNKDSNRIKEFQTIIEKYVRMYKDNKSKIERRDTILKFKEDMKAIELCASEYLDADKAVLAGENEIACFIDVLSNMERQNITEEKQQMSEKQECEDLIAHIIYEKISAQIHSLRKEMDYRISNRDMIDMEKDTLADEIARLKRLLHIYECAKQQLNVDEYTREYHLIKAKVEVAKSDNMEYEPERIRLGSYLKNTYTTLLKEADTTQSNYNSERNKITENLNLQKQKSADYQQSIEKLIGEISACKARIQGFDSKEDSFNRLYNEILARNIIGDYEPGLLEVKKEQYIKQQTELIRNNTTHKKQIEELREKLKSSSRNLEDLQSDKNKLDFKLSILENDLEKLENELKERLIIMKYLDLDESQVFNTQKLIEAADKKISECDRIRRELEKDENTLQQEWKKLTSGEILELPQDFKEMLSALELHPVYGMSWLDKNGYSKEENLKLIRKQPFIPYSLILTEGELKKLEAHAHDIYTSFPIPIIKREALEKSIVEGETGMVHMEGITFYLWFNEQLLDEEALQIMVSQKEQELQRKREQIELRINEYQEYLARKNKLLAQKVSKEELDRQRSDIEDTKKSISDTDEKINNQKDDIAKCNDSIDEMSKLILTENQTIENYKRREADFDIFIKDYALYQKDRQDMAHKTSEKSRLEENKKQSQALQDKYAESIRDLDVKIMELQKQTEELQAKYTKYQEYNDNKEWETDKTLDELEARFEAITTLVSSQLRVLEENLAKTGKRLDKEEKELKRLCDKYKLAYEDFKDEIYDAKEELHKESMLEDVERKYKVKENLWNEEDKQIGILSSKITDKLIAMKQQCDKEEPLSPEEIKTLDFDAEKNKLEYRKREIDLKLATLRKKEQLISENLTAFAEYQDFIITSHVSWTENPEIMEPKRLREFAGTLRRDYRLASDERKRKKDRLQNQLNQLMRKETYQEDYYKKPLETMLSVTDDAKVVLSQLNTTLQSYESQMAKLQVDISLVEKEKEKIEGLIEDYIREVHTNLAKIDNNSTITIREKSIKMLKLVIPTWEENEGIYHQRLDDFVGELTLKGIEIYEKNENPSEYFGTRITTKNIYDTVVGIGNIQIKLYKIEEQREYPITWAEVARNSGGEGFLSAFVILSSLLYYMRRDETDIFADQNEGKVLVMDNPFAQTNAAHLLKPLMDIAKKTNTQLICLSGLGGDSIYGRFDNIYVLNLVNAALRGGTQYLRGNHLRGATEETIVPSRIEVVEQQSLLF
jgi:hypothetical protein